MSIADWFRSRVARPPSPVTVTYRFIAESEHWEFRNEDFWASVSQQTEELEAEVNSVVQKHLGPGFRAANIELRRGSVELLLVVVGAYSLIADYSGFLESLQLIRRQIRSLFERFMRGRSPAPVVVTGGIVGVTYSAAKEPPGVRLGRDVDYVLIYLLFTHAALLGVVIWIAVGLLQGGGR